MIKALHSVPSFVVLHAMLIRKSNLIFMATLWTSFIFVSIDFWELTQVIKPLYIPYVLCLVLFYLFINIRHWKCIAFYFWSNRLISYLPLLMFILQINIESNYRIFQTIYPNKIAAEDFKSDLFETRKLIKIIFQLRSNWLPYASLEFLDFNFCVNTVSIYSNFFLKKRRLLWKKVNRLGFNSRYADDTILIAKKSKKLQKLLQSLV